MATKGKAKRTPVTAADLRKQADEMAAKAKELEAKAALAEMENCITKADVDALYGKVTAKFPRASKLSVLNLIGKQMGIPRLVISQGDAKPRAKKGTTKPKTSK